MLLASAHRLLVGEARDDVEDAPVPTRHSTSMGQDLRGSVWRFILGHETREILKDVPEGSSREAKFRALFEAGCLLAHVESVSVPGTEERWKNAEVPEIVLEDGLSVSGFVVATSQTPLEPGKVEAAILRSYLEHDALGEALDRESGWRAFLWRHSDGQHSLVAQLRPGEDARSYEVVALPEASSETRLPAEFEILTNKRVAVIGLGSAGSKIAVSLARSGVRKLLLVDDDVLLPENLVRHALDWRSVGAHKVDAARSAIERIVTGAEVTVRRRRMDGQEATAGSASVDEELAKCDLVIDATASPQGFNRIAHVVAQAKTRFIWLEIYAGGIGGMVARYRPGHDPDPHSMRQGILTWMEAQDAEVPETVVDYGVLSPDGETVVASDADVSVIAAYASDLALDTLSDREPSEFLSNVYFIGLRRGWVFEQALHVLPLDVELGESTTGPADPEAPRRALEFLKEVISSDDDDSACTS